MNTNERLEKIEKQIEVLKKKVDLVYDKISNHERIIQCKPERSESELYDEAKRVVIEAGKASTALLQRKLQIGYASAARFLEDMEVEGIVGPRIGAKPRDVLIKG